MRASDGGLDAMPIWRGVIHPGPLLFIPGTLPNRPYLLLRQRSHDAIPTAHLVMRLVPDQRQKPDDDVWTGGIPGA
jgi:hypothetical protein